MAPSHQFQVLLHILIPVDLAQLAQSGNLSRWREQLADTRATVDSRIQRHQLTVRLTIQPRPAASGPRAVIDSCTRPSRAMRPVLRLTRSLEKSDLRLESSAQETFALDGGWAARIEQSRLRFYYSANFQQRHLHTDNLSHAVQRRRSMRALNRVITRMFTNSKIPMAAPSTREAA